MQRNLEGQDTTDRIIVTIGSDRDMVPAIEKCEGTYNGRRRLNKSCCSCRIKLGIPVIVGVNNATNLIKNGQELTIDAESGVIYHGHASII